MCRLPTNLNTAVHFKRSNDEKASMKTKAVQLKLCLAIYLFLVQPNHTPISSNSRWISFEFLLQYNGASQSINPDQSLGHCPKRGLSDIFLSEGKIRSGDYASSSAAAMVVDRLRDTCPWGMGLNRELN